MIRKTLDNLYLWCGYLAAFFLVMIAVAIIIQVVGRIFLLAFDFTRLSGFFLAAATFLALPHTLKRGGHVRVELALSYLAGTKRATLESACCILSACVVGYIAYEVLIMAYISWSQNDVTTGMMALPLWMPQSCMALGLGLLAIALIDELVTVLAGRTPSYVVNQDAVL